MFVSAQSRHELYDADLPFRILYVCVCRVLLDVQRAPLVQRRPSLNHERARVAVPASRSVMCPGRSAPRAARAAVRVVRPAARVTRVAARVVRLAARPARGATSATGNAAPVARSTASAARPATRACRLTQFACGSIYSSVVRLVAQIAARVTFFRFAGDVYGLFNCIAYWKIQKPVVLSHTDRRAGQNKTDSMNAQGKGAGPTYSKPHRAKREHALKRGWFIPRADARSARRGQ